MPSGGPGPTPPSSSAAWWTKAISGYQRREGDWQTPPKCADLEFQPRSGSLTLRPNDTGSFNAKAKAKQDGRISELDARLTTQHNAVFSPTRAGGQQARFDYTRRAAAPEAQ